MTNVRELEALAVLRRHTIGAFNGSQVACAAPECRQWMTTDVWHQHVARIIGAEMAATTVDRTCNCWRCHEERGEAIMTMIVCAKCGNKRCPHANDHDNDCTGSNDTGQVGSAYELGSGAASVRRLAGPA